MNVEFDILNTPLPAGLSVIEASAGTGKTYAISHLVPRLLLEERVSDLSKILIVTFTNDAADELAARTRMVLEALCGPPTADEQNTSPVLHALRQKFDAKKIENVIGRALLDFDRLSASTIHSFCLSVLQTDGVLCGLPVLPELSPDASDLAEEVLCDLWEELVSREANAAAVATGAKWSPRLAQRGAQALLARPLAELCPPAVPFPNAIQEVVASAMALTADHLQELALLLENVPAWSAKAPGNWEALLESLGVPSLTLRCSLAKELQEAADWVNGRSREGRQSKAQIADSAAVQWAVALFRQIEMAEWHLQAELAGRAQERIVEKLRAQRRITYDGLVGVVGDALAGSSSEALIASLRVRYQIALVDESQDTDPGQFAIFQKVFAESSAGHSLVLIGDPKQAIYAFRDADVNTYLHARDLATDRLFSLTKTFRAPEPLVQAVNAVFGAERAFHSPRISFQPATSGLAEQCLVDPSGSPGVGLEAWIVEDPNNRLSNEESRNTCAVEVTATEITRLLSSQATLRMAQKEPRLLQPDDIAILVSDRRQGIAVERALRTRGVPAIRAANDDIMASEEAREMVSVLRAVREPRRTGLVKAALATRYFGRTAADLSRAEETGRDIEQFQQWSALWESAGISTVLGTMDKAEGISLRLASLPQGERRLTNFRQLADLLHKASGECAQDPERTLVWLKCAVDGVDGADGRTAIEERQMQLESDRDAVKIVTMHSAKGLEYPLVFCPFLWMSRVPKGIQKAILIEDDSPERTVVFHEKLCQDVNLREMAQKEALEDRLRLAYVALTRAQVKVWVLAGDLGTTQPSALDWLLRPYPQQTYQDWVAGAAQPGRAARHREALKRIAQAAPDSVIISRPPEIHDECWEPSEKPSSESLTAASPPEIPTGWGFTSFSQLTREKSPHAPQGDLVLSRAASSAPSLMPDPNPNPFTAAPGGAAMGTALHEWIERWDFGALDQRVLDAHLEARGMGGQQGAPVRALFGRVAAMLEILRSTQLPELEASVAAACPDPAASEWHFQLPIREALDPQMLAGIFEKHGHGEYAARLALLPVEQLRGYLHGFLDRIAFHNATWGVIDWKTNVLGQSAEDYCESALLQCAMDSHYLLQAHLYLTALRRFLGPDAQIAGAWLIFLRGIQPETSRGVLTIRPATALSEDLDKLFGGGHKI